MSEEYVISDWLVIIEVSEYWIKTVKKKNTLQSLREHKTYKNDKLLQEKARYSYFYFIWFCASQMFKQSQLSCFFVWIIHIQSCKSLIYVFNRNWSWHQTDTTIPTRKLQLSLPCTENAELEETHKDQSPMPEGLWFSSPHFSVSDFFPTVLIPFSSSWQRFHQY